MKSSTIQTAVTQTIQAHCKIFIFYNISNNMYG